MSRNTSDTKQFRGTRSKTVNIRELTDRQRTPRNGDYTNVRHNSAHDNDISQQYRASPQYKSPTSGNQPIYSYRAPEVKPSTVRLSKSYADLGKSYGSSIDNPLQTPFTPRSSHRSFISDVNLSLIERDRFYAFDEYVEVYQTLYTNGADMYRMYMFTNRYTGSDFCIHESELPGTINVNDTIKRFGMVNGRDFVESNEIHHNKWGFNRRRRIRIFTPMSFKKLLLYSNDNRMVDYYVFLDEAISSYTAYEKEYMLYHRKKKDSMNLDAVCENHGVMSNHGSVLL